MGVRLRIHEYKSTLDSNTLSNDNLLDIETENAFHFDKLYWDLSLILTNTIDGTVDGNEFKTIYGGHTQPSNLDPSFNAKILADEELLEVVEWQSSLNFIDFSTYQNYYENLKPEIKEELEMICDLSREEQYEMIQELFSFFRNASDNKNWLLFLTL